MYDPRELANYILDVADRRGLRITNMALQKIMYFAHGYSLAERGKPLIGASFEAWQHGPVLPVVYRQFARHGRDPIRTRASRVDVATGCDIPIEPRLAEEDAQFVTRIAEMLGPKDALVLRQMSHEPGGPWDQVWNGDQRTNPGMVIPHASIKTHFIGKTSPKRSGYVH